MNRPIVLAHEFVKVIPNELAERTLYVSMDYATVVHRCCCGCGREVVTPLSPTDWRLIYDGVSVSLYPSIGNWSFECQSHYWVEDGKVLWGGRWSSERIAAGRARDRRAKEMHYGGVVMEPQEDPLSAGAESSTGFWSWPSRALDLVRRSVGALVSLGSRKR